MAKNPVGKTKNTAKPTTPSTRKPRSQVRRPTAKHNPAQVSLDLVNNPPHYKMGKIEIIDKIEDDLTPEEFVGYCKGNSMKYTSREKHKGGTQDLEKARWYLDRAIKNRKENAGEPK